jgi:fused signal recognition particle receptor
MFDKLKKAFSNAAKGIGQREISEKVLDDTLFDLEMSLLESDVAQEAVGVLSAKLKGELLGLKLEKGDDASRIIRSRLQNNVAEVFARAGKFDLVEKIAEKKTARSGPFVIVFLGINGTGKTTTVAKVAHLLRKSGFTVVIAAGDTHRAGAIEQLTEHANRLALKVVAQRYGADPSAVGRDAVEHAKKDHIDVVLVDTAGRMQTSKNLMDEMAKIVRVVKPDAKLFIGDALAGNDTINQAREFFQYTNFDGAILTKIDADAKGGAAISIAYVTSKPIVYVGIGQGYDDLIPFEPDKFIESLFGTATEVRVQDLMSMPRTEQPTIRDVAQQEVGPVVEQIKTMNEYDRPAAKTPAVAAIPISKPAATQEEEKVDQPVTPITMPKRSIPERIQKEESLPPAIPSRKEVPESEYEQPSHVDVPAPPEAAPTLEEPREKKGRFGGFFKKKSDEERKKEEEAKRKAAEERAKEEDERAKTEEEEIKRKEKEKEEKKKKRKEDKDTEEDKVIYLTDEDIEDLLK